MQSQALKAPNLQKPNKQETPNKTTAKTTTVQNISWRWVDMTLHYSQGKWSALAPGLKLSAIGEAVQLKTDTVALERSLGLNLNSATY